MTNLRLGIDDTISAHFKLSDAVYLHEWGIYCFPGNEIYQNILEMAKVMEKISYIFDDRRIFTTSWWRPEKYNEYIKGATNSQHLLGKAVDFLVEGLNPDQARAFIRPVVSSLGIRMEDVPGQTWVHVDLKPVYDDSRRLFAA